MVLLKFCTRPLPVLYKGNFPINSGAAQPQDEALPRLPCFGGDQLPPKPAANVTPVKEANALQQEAKPNKESCSEEG